jgi:hypothetical protein
VSNESRLCFRNEPKGEIDWPESDGEPYVFIRQWNWYTGVELSLFGRRVLETDGFALEFLGLLSNGSRHHLSQRRSPLFEDGLEPALTWTDAKSVPGRHEPLWNAGPSRIWPILGESPLSFIGQVYLRPTTVVTNHLSTRIVYVFGDADENRLCLINQFVDAESQSEADHYRLEESIQDIESSNWSETVVKAAVALRDVHLETAILSHPDVTAFALQSISQRGSNDSLRKRAKEKLKG